MGLLNVAQLILPEGLLAYFSMVKVEDSKSQIKIYLEEKNNLNNPMYENKGFHANALVNDFPIRRKSLLLDLCRRCWIHKETGEYLSRDFKYGIDSQNLFCGSKKGYRPFPCTATGF